MASRFEEAWRAYRIADSRYPIFDGGGAQLLGGRWNSPGRRVIYAARSLAGAMLEVLVHTNTGRVPKHHRYIEIEIPAGSSVESVDTALLPGWDEPDYRHSRAYGDAWYDSRRSALLIVPSVVCRPETNLLINQEHPEFSRLRASEPYPIHWNGRLFGHEAINTEN